MSTVDTVKKRKRRGREEEEKEREKEREKEKKRERERERKRKRKKEEGDGICSFMKAAFDATFWLHHCNIDRYWQKYLEYHAGARDEASYLGKYTLLQFFALLSFICLSRHHLPTHIHAHIHAHIHTYTHTYTHTRTHTRIHAHIHIVRLKTYSLHPLHNLWTYVHIYAHISSSCTSVMSAQFRCCSYIVPTTTEQIMCARG